MANLWKPGESTSAGEGPSWTNSSRDSLFEGVRQQRTEQAASHPYQPFSLDDFRPPTPLYFPIDPLGPIVATSHMNLTLQTQNAAPSAKEYGMNKPMPFSGDQTKVKTFLQECLVYINMNKEVYTTDKLRIGFILSCMNEKEAKDWRELYLESIKDPNTGKLMYPNFGIFLAEVCKAFQSTDCVQDAVHKLETLKQGKKTVEEIIMEFKQLMGEAGLESRSRSDHIHLIGLFRKALNPQLSQQIMFGEVIPQTINDWFNKAIQFDTNYQEAMAIFGSNFGRKNKNKGGNKNWYKPAGKKDPNAIDVDTLTLEERQMLMKQGKCFKCRKTGHRTIDCPDKDDKKEKKKEELKKSDLVKNAYATIKALTKDQKDAFAKMMLEGGDEDF